tara:strand:+ start:32 stop:283 length:252 start_codon:yes stop_codon:yes gene_type:complete
MSILRKHIEKIDVIKDGITEDSEKILEVIDIDALFGMNKEEIKIYITEILYDYWESKDKLLEKSIKLGEDKALKLIKAVNVES